MTTNPGAVLQRRAADPRSGLADAATPQGDLSDEEVREAFKLLGLSDPAECERLRSLRPAERESSEPERYLTSSDNATGPDAQAEPNDAGLESAP